MESILCIVVLLMVMFTGIQSAAVPEFEYLEIDVQDSPRMKRKAVPYSSRRWTNNQVPYTMTGFSAEEEAIIHEAIDEWNNKTCLEFTALEDVEDANARYIDFVNTGSYCYSWYGMTSWREERSQEIKLGKSSCKQVPVILHEIGHAIGFYHEIQRPDRDNYIILNDDNFVSSAFDKKDNSLTFDVPYDFYSIMHYNDQFLSTNGNPTYTAVEPAMQGVGGSAQHLSQRDAWVANKMYGCADDCVNACPEGAFKDKDCNCVCAGPESQSIACPE